MSSLPLLARLWLAPPGDEAIAEAHRSLGLPLGSARELAEAFTDLLVLDVPPYGSVFLERSGELNGATSEAVSRAYAQSEFDPSALREVAAPDHLGLCLGFLHLRRHEPSDGYDWSWIEVCCLAVLREPRVHPFYAGLAEATLAWRATLTPQPPLPSGKGEGEEPHPPAPSPPSGEGEDVDSLLEALEGREEEDDVVGLGRIVRFFLAPARCGMYLSRSRLGSVAVALGLRLPFGSRFDVARILFVAAGEAELADRLFSALEAEADAWAEGYRSIAERYPAWGAHADQWTSRLATTRKVLRAMRSLAAD